MPERDISFCHPVLQDAWKKASAEYAKRYPNASQPFLTTTYRSDEEQAKLYAKGRTAPGKIVTQIKSGGKHNKMPAEAYDVGFRKADGKADWSGVNFRNMAVITKQVAPRVKWGGDWTGGFVDLPHYEI